MEQTVLFGRYRLLERAGAGGSAQVWRAVDEETGDEVAVKRLHPVVFADPTARRRFERESRALETLESPNIVRIRDSHLTDDEAAIVLDYVPGTSLADHLAQHGKLPVGEAVAVVRDIAEALMTAHSAGVVHRDVKPANIILAADRRALLTDFGVARQDAEETIHGSITEVTGHGFVVGSLRYMAPEQLRGDLATPASDQYGLAAVACRMLTGSPPFDGTTPLAIAEAQAAGPPALPDVDPPLREALKRGLAAHPADRFPDVAAFATAVGAAVRPGVAADATRVIPAVVPRVDAPNVVDDAQPAAGSAALTDAPRIPRTARAPTQAVGALVVAVGIAALVALASIGQPRSPASDAVVPPRQEATAAPSAPPTAEPAVSAGGKADGGGKDGGGKAKGRDDGKGNDKGKGNN